jgi:hypothetical protein
MGSHVLQHHHYNPELAPTKFHHCGTLEESMKSQKYEEDNQVQKYINYASRKLRITSMHPEYHLLGYYAV